MTRSVFSAMTQMLLIILFTNCYGQNHDQEIVSESTLIHTTKHLDGFNEAQIKPTEFYEDMDKLKYIAIGALLVLICCCCGLIFIVRRQVRKTEEGTEIQKYIRKRSQAALPNDHSASSLQKTAAVNVSQTGLCSVPSRHHQDEEPDVSLDIQADTAGYSTPGGELDDAPEYDKHELYLVKIAQQNEMKLKFATAEQAARYQDQRDEDEDFGQTLNDAMQFEQSQQDEIFNDMASEQYVNTFPQYQQPEPLQEEDEPELQRTRSKRKSYAYRDQMASAQDHY